MLYADSWYAHYERAEAAMARENWRATVEELNQAIARRGDSAAHARTYGMKVVDYFPYLRLGVAYYHLGQPAAALEAFATEERLGAIASSPPAVAELSRVRGLAITERDRIAGDERSRREKIVGEGLAGAGALENKGDLEGAMAALVPVLAVDAGNNEASLAMERLRGRAAIERQNEEDTRLATEYETSARDALALGEFSLAASLLRKALALQPGREREALLGRAQQGLIDSVSAAQRSARLQSALERARVAEASGDLEVAGEAIEVALALDPELVEAVSLRSRLTERLAAQRIGVAVAESLRRARSELAAGNLEAALTEANRLLATDRGNADALEVVGAAYAGINRRLFAGAERRNLPPAIRFDDRRIEEAGDRVEVTDRAAARLAGLVIDTSPVSIRLTDASGANVEPVVSAQTLGDYVITQFGANLVLVPGKSLLRIVATDAEGLVASSEYALRYDRSLLRSPWFLLLLGLLPAGAGTALGWLGWRRARRRALERQRRFNPYIAGVPVFSRELFFGREALIERILQTIHTNSLMLHGERRIGKTSLLHQVRLRLEALEDPDYRFSAVYVDLQGTEESKLFATIGDAVFEAFAAEPSQRDRVPALARPSGYDHHELARELRLLLEELQRRTPKRARLVLLIDEVDELNHYDPRVNQKLRSLFMKRFAESLVAVVAGVRIRKEWDKETSPWYNFFEEIEVAPITPEAARELVLRPIRGLLRVEPGVVERVLEISEGRPYRIQLCCLSLVRRAHAENRRALSLADVEAFEREGRE